MVLITNRRVQMYNVHNCTSCHTVVVTSVQYIFKAVVLKFQNALNCYYTCRILELKHIYIYIYIYTHTHKEYYCFIHINKNINLSVLSVQSFRWPVYLLNLLLMESLCESHTGSLRFVPFEPLSSLFTTFLFTACKETKYIRKCASEQELVW